MRAVIFDLDGTLIDSAPDIAASVNRVLAADDLAPHSLDAIRGMIGDGAKQLLERAFAAHGRVAEPRHLAAFIADYQDNPVVETRIYDGILPALGVLREAGHLLGLCTNKPIGPARKILAALDLAPFFAAVTGGDSTPYKKPDPRHLAATLAEMEVGEAVMIGDHENDMLAAEGLGVQGIFVTWGYGQGQSSFVAHSPGELLGLIAKLGG
ncbi:HAD-IA family hydrolase [Acidocella aromatica]|uniref:phosphoglycolate phosphatase n=1 Tax=Acidocella aromatica TaxID=1303579 RepID=A0A840VHP6_9PROT|nr:HAD-IA family hydrolase [Acidocella aromatica]MBB5371829.1 phosphoglycolate phosphatase [Acidocella aromatica]